MKIEIADACTAAGWICWLDSHPGLAAWVQTVGVILTIAAAVITAQLPLWNARSEQRRKRREQLASTAMAGAMVAGVIESLIRESKAAAEAKALFPGIGALIGLRSVAQSFEVLTAEARTDHQVAVAIASIKMLIANVEELLVRSGDLIEASQLTRLAAAVQSQRSGLANLVNFLATVAAGSQQSLHEYLEDAGLPPFHAAAPSN